MKPQFTSIRISEKLTCQNCLQHPGDALQYIHRVLNNLEPPGMPLHYQCLNVGAAVMLLRNLDSPRLCDCTQLIIKQNLHILDITILHGQASGETNFVALVPSDLPFSI